MKDLYTDNYKILIKEIKDDGKIAHTLELGELILDVHTTQSNLWI